MEINLRVIKSPLLIIVGIATAIIFWQIGLSEISLIILCSIVIISSYYAAVYLYIKNDSMMGGLTQAHYGYSTGFIIMLSGNLLLTTSFILEIKWMLYLGSILILAGTGFMVVSSSLLFNHIIRRGIKSSS